MPRLRTLAQQLWQASANQVQLWHVAWRLHLADRQSFDLGDRPGVAYGVFLEPLNLRVAQQGPAQVWERGVLQADV